MDRILSLLGLGNNSCHRALKLSLKINYGLLNYQCKLPHYTDCTLSVRSAGGQPSLYGSPLKKLKWASGPVDQVPKYSEFELYSCQTELCHFSHDCKLNVTWHVFYSDHKSHLLDQLS